MKLGQVLKVGAISIRNILMGGNLVSVSLLRHPKKMIMYITECLFLFKTMNEKRGIPQRNVYKVLQAENVESIKLGNLKTGGAFFGVRASFLADIVNHCLITQIIKPKVIFEIGTNKGYSAFHFALNTPDDAIVYTLDLPKDGASPRYETTALDDVNVREYMEYDDYSFKGSEVSSKVCCLYGDSATFDFLPFYGTVDLFFIDGAHSYEYVRNDTVNALKCAHPGSVLVWHDFGRMGINGVSKFILEFSSENEVYSIPGGSLAYMVVK